MRSFGNAQRTILVSQDADPLALRRLTRLQRWRRRLYVYGILYLLVMLGSFPFHLADKLILFPTGGTIRIGEADRRTLDVPGGTLEIIAAKSRAARSAAPEAFVLEFTGNASRAEHVAEDTAWQWQRHAVEVWAVNYPGYGASTGPARLKTIASTALAAYDALHTRTAGRPIFVVGTSLGTTAALHVGANRDVAGLVLTNPPPLRQLILRHHGWWNLWLLAVPVSLGVPSELDSIANAKRCRAPAIFVTSRRDEVVPFAYQQLVADAYAGSKRVLSREGANHNDPIEGNDQAWMTEQVEWLWKVRSDGADSNASLDSQTLAP